MEKKLSIAVIIILIANICNSQSDWFIQPSFTTKNLYDCKESGVNVPYLAADSGTIFRTTNNGYNWTPHDFNDPLISGSALKYVLGQSNDNWLTVGEGSAFGFYYQGLDSVLRIPVSPQTTLEAISVLNSGSYVPYVAAGHGGNFYIKEGVTWRKDNPATTLAAGRNINYSWGALFVGDNGLIMKADSVGILRPNGERIRWRVIPSGTTKNLYCVSGGGLSYVAAGEGGTILKTTNLGETWTPVVTETNEDLYAVWLGYAYLACGAHGTILKSYDASYNLWYKQPTPTTKDLYFIMSLGYQEYISGGQNGIFMRTTNGGGSRKAFTPNILMEGRYNSSSNLLTGDTVSVSVRSSVAPYNILGTWKSKLNNAGSGSFEFSPSILDSVPYYIQVKHRSSVEVWSKTPQVFSSSHTLSYQFYNAANKAYGDNQKQVDASPLRFAMYSGDVNQDGLIDLSDITNVFNDANNFLTGYLVTDITGDNIVDLSDLTITYNNSSSFVSAITP